MTMRSGVAAPPTAPVWPPSNYHTLEGFATLEYYTHTHTHTHTKLCAHACTSTQKKNLLSTMKKTKHNSLQFGLEVPGTKGISPRKLAFSLPSRITTYSSHTLARIFINYFLFVNVNSSPNVGLELMTPRPWVPWSTDWASQVPLIIYSTHLSRLFSQLDPQRFFNSFFFFFF